MRTLATHTHSALGPLMLQHLAVGVLGHNAQENPTLLKNAKPPAPGKLTEKARRIVNKMRAAHGMKPLEELPGKPFSTSLYEEAARFGIGDIVTQPTKVYGVVDDAWLLTVSEHLEGRGVIMHYGDLAEYIVEQAFDSNGGFPFRAGMRVEYSSAVADGPTFWIDAEGTHPFYGPWQEPAPSSLGRVVGVDPDTGTVRIRT